MTDTSANGDTHWQSFMNCPSTYVESRHLAQCFGSAISDAGCARLLQLPRLRSRLDNLLAIHHGLPQPIPPELVDAADRNVAMASRDELHDITLRAGAIRWAKSFAAMILSKDASALNGVLRQDLYDFAMINRDLSGPTQPIGSVDDLLARLTADGRDCLAAWCKAVPAAVGARVRLRLVPNELNDDPVEGLAEVGPLVIRRAAG